MTRWLAGGVAVLVVALAALLVVPGFLDWTQYRETVSARLGDLLGVPVRIDGELEISLLPAPVMTAYDVVVDRGAVQDAGTGPDGTGGEAPPLLAVDIIEVQLSLAPLLTGAVEVERAVLVNPEATVVAAPDGIDWFGGGLADRADRADGQSMAVRLDRLTIENGSVLWRDTAEGVDRRVVDIFAQATAQGLTGPAGIVGSARLGGVAYTVDLSTGRVTAGGALPIRLALGVDGIAGELRFAGLVRLAERTAQGELEVAGVDPVGLWDRLNTASAPGAPVPGLPAGGGIRTATVGLEASVEAGLDQVSLDASVLDIAGSRGRGTIVWQASPPGDRPQLDIAATFNRVLADDWVDGFALADLVQRRLAGDGPLVPAGLSAAVDIDLAAATWRDGILRNLRLIAALDDGHLTLSRLSGELPGSSELTVHGTVTPDGRAGAVDLEAVAAAGDLRGLLAWAGVDVSQVPDTRLRSLSGQVRLRGQHDEWQLLVPALSVDGSRLQGGLAWRDDGVRPGFGVRLVGDHVDLDDYHVDGAVGLMPGALADWTRIDRLIDLADGIDANIEIDIGPFSVHGHSADRLEVDATLEGGGLILRRARVAGLDGIDASLEGRIGRLDPMDDVALHVAVAAERADVLADLLGEIRPADGDAPGTSGWPVPSGAADDRADDGAAAEAASPAAAMGADALALVRLGGDRPFAVDGRIDGAGDRVVASLSGTVAEGHFDLGGAIDTPWQAPRYDLAVRMVFEDGDRAREAMAPGYQPRAPIGPVDLYAQIIGPPSAVALEDLRVTVGDLAAAGRAAIERDHERPRVTLDLRTGDIPVLDYLPAPRVRLSASAPDMRWSSAPLDLALFDRLDADLRLTAAGLRFGDLAIADVAGRAVLRDGALDIGGLDGEIFGGRLGLSGRLAAGDPVEMVADLTLVDADLAGALAGLLGLEGLSGTVSLGIDATGQGRSTAELARSLDGEGLVTVRDGAIQDLDLARIERAVSELEEPIGFLDELTAALEGGRTGIQALNARFAVVGGIAHTEDLSIVTPAGRAEGRGLVDLADQRVDLSNDFTLFGAPEAPPFVVQVLGPLSSPVRRSQTQALQAYFGRRAAEALAERFDDLIVDEDAPTDRDTSPAAGSAPGSAPGTNDGRTGVGETASEPPATANDPPGG